MAPKTSSAGQARDETVASAHGAKTSYENDLGEPQACDAPAPQGETQTRLVRTPESSVETPCQPSGMRGQVRLKI